MTCWTVQWRDAHSLTVNVLYYRSSQHDDMLNGAVAADVIPIHWQWTCCIIEVANMMTCWTVQWRDTHSLTVKVLYYRSSQHDDMLNGAVTWYPFIDSERVVL